jgi:hypothetical protein
LITHQTLTYERYGYRPIPTLIDGQEFRLLRNTLEDMGITEAELFDIWYREDTNAVPSVYILQPISSILVNFANRVGNAFYESIHIFSKISFIQFEPELQLKDQRIWWQTLSKLQKLLRIAANKLFNSNKINEDAKHNYMMSGLVV